jgi:ubiquinone/menaquinone biosynthesis C-methylase UbiE
MVDGDYLATAFFDCLMRREALMTEKRGKSDIIGSGLWDAENTAEQLACASAWLETQALHPFMLETADRTLELMALQPGERVLDVGCGTGVLLPVFAQAVAPAGEVIGLDRSAKFLEDARQRIERTQTQGTVTLQQGDALALPFPDERFDAAHCERVLLHVDDPDLALREMRRVVRPGGRVVVADLHHMGGAIDHVDPLAIRLIFEHALQSYKQPRIGLELYRRMAHAGFMDRQVRIVTTFETELDPDEAADFAEHAAQLVAEGRLTPERAQAAMEYLQAADRGQWYAAYTLIFVVLGHVPSITHANTAS